MNLRDLEYLVALAEHRHFGRAAAAAYVSQPTLSTQIKKLEAHLGTPLVERGNREVLLTTAGEAVVERARVILDQARDIRELTRRAQDPRAGVLRLGVFPTLAPYLLPHVMPGLHEQFPDLEVLLVEERTAELTDRLRLGALDAAILALPVAGDGLAVEPLFREEFVLAVPADHELGLLPPPLRTEFLDGAELLLLADGHCLRDQALEVCHRAGAHERVGFRATSLETLRLMVAAGTGITLLPRLAVSPPVAPNEHIRLVEFDQPRPHRDLGLIWRSTSAYGDLLGEVAEILRDLPAGLVEPI